MEMTHRTEPIHAKSAPKLKKTTHYPEPFAALMSGRAKRKLGDMYGLSNFGVNFTSLAPGAVSALFHAHSKQDEFVYVLDGNATLLVGDREYAMSAGDCVGFRAGSCEAHHLVNRTDSAVSFLEIGDRSAGDEVCYPNDDLQAVMNASGEWEFRHTDGTPY